MTAVVFDFDQTLAEKHLFYELYTGKRNAKWGKVKPAELLSNYDFIVNYIFGGKDRIETLARELAGMNTTLTISSHGYVKDIVAALDFLKNNGFDLSSKMFKFIHGKKAGPYNAAPFGIYVTDSEAFLAFNGDKFDFINNFIRDKYDRCIFFLDDDGQAYFDRLEETKYDKYRIIPVPPEGGLTRETLDRLKEEMVKCIQCRIRVATHVCGQCREVQYCGKACQAQHWGKVHSESCEK